MDKSTHSQYEAAKAGTGGVPALRLLGRCDVKLFSLDQDQRIGRQYDRATGREPSAPPADSDCFLLIRRDYLLEDSVLKGLARTAHCVLAADDPVDGAPVYIAAHVGRSHLDAVTDLLKGIRSAPPDGLFVMRAGDLGEKYNQALRKRGDPFALPVRADTRRALEKRLFGNAYKGATDFITKYVWPPFALPATRLAAFFGLTPNMVTFVSLLMVIAATYLFMEGAFAWGIAAAWLMTFLDTVDGKLARVTLTASKWGNVFDHGIDLIHPPFWYAAWWWGLINLDYAAVPSGLLTIALVIILAGYLIGRIEEGIFLWRFKFEIHMWRPFDFFFRHIVARRNPNIFILMVAIIVGALWDALVSAAGPVKLSAYPGADWGFVAVAGWTALCCAVHAIRIGHAWYQSLKSPIRSWLLEGRS